MVSKDIVVTENELFPIIRIGRRGTYGVERINFDCAWLADKFGAGSAVLMMKRPCDPTAYPAVTSQSGNVVTWDVSDIDTSFKGIGKAELFWYVNNGLAKSMIFNIGIGEDIGNTISEPPDPYESWIEALTELGADAQNAANAAIAAVESINAVYVRDNILVFGENTRVVNNIIVFGGVT